MPPRLLAGLALALVVAVPASAAAPPRLVSFRHDVYPLLRSRCLRCHQGSNPTSGVRLDVRADLLGESNGRPLVQPGNGNASRLVHVVAGRVPDRVMPPVGRGKPLTTEQVGMLRAWIDQGLPWDEQLLPPPGLTEHWAFRPVRRQDIPRFNTTWPLRTPIDAFVALAWQKKGLVPVGEADRRTLIRRLSLDLIGLPPAPDEIETFVKDSSPDAYERLVDRLLASPRHGERWGRHWLDVARYADSEGYESNHLRPHAWRYRDWVIDSFNRDRPFAEFIRLQIAGDEVRPYRDDNLIATGFLAAARLSSNEEDKPRQRNDVLVDVVNTTANAFLGLTMHCAQCHNHKFDPITARDYYRLQAFFITGQPANLALRDPVLIARYQAKLPKGYEKAWQRRQEIYDQAHRDLVTRTLRSLPEAQQKAYALPPGKRSEEEERLARLADLKIQFTPNRIEREIPADHRKEYDALKKKLADWERTVPEMPQTFGFYAPGTASALVRVLPMKGFYPLPYEPEQLARMSSRLLVGGDVHRLGPALEPGWPAVFGPTPRSLTPTPRQALANWLASPGNPLVARVWVNRLWQWHFGRGIVETSSDFGLRGSPPTHPELLDWLASEFLASGGSTKHIHRLIVLSSAYRLASTPHSANLEIDSDNAYLWRWSPRRLEAEVIRDSLLWTSNEFAASIGGAPDSDELTSRRRGVYLLQKRDHPPMLQGLFDGPVASAESCARRGVSTVPLQALYLLNNAFVRDRAAAVAARVRSLVSEDRGRQIVEAFRLTLGRTPDDIEMQASRRFFERHGEEEALTNFCQSLMNLNEYIYLE